MKLLKTSILAIVLLGSALSFAQQLPQFSQYMFNTISINPAYAGSRQTFSVVGLHRSQWAGIIDKAPSTETLSLHMPLKNEKIGVGLSVIQDELGYENFSYVYGDFSYTIKTGLETKLAFGIKAGLTQYSLDNDFRQNNDNDPAVYGIENRWGPNIGAGVYWHSNKWYLGFSAPRIYKTDYNTDEIRALERVSYYLTGGYVFDLATNVKLKPSTLLKFTNGAPLSIDLNANFLFYEKFWIGPSYRINQSSESWGAFGGMVDFQVSNQLRIGYAYERPNSDLSQFAGATHEVLMVFELKRSNKRVKSPRYF